MWSKIDDQIASNPKFFIAGELLKNKDGPAIALGVFVEALAWCGQNLTDGFIHRAVLQRFRMAEKPLVVADALIRAGLFDQRPDGIQIHDYLDYNKPAADVKKARAADRARKYAPA